MRTGLYAAPAGNSRICSSVASFDSFMSITVPLMIDLKPELSASYAIGRGSGLT